MELILEAVLKQKSEATQKTGGDSKESENSCVEQRGKMDKLDKVDQVDKVDSLVDDLLAMKVSPAPELSCGCTRKCKTKLCICYQKKVACSSSCHPHNNSCTNK